MDMKRLMRLLILLTRERPVPRKDGRVDVYSYVRTGKIATEEA
jgi:hypothetical protein